MITGAATKHLPRAPGQRYSDLHHLDTTLTHTLTQMSRVRNITLTNRPPLLPIRRGPQNARRDFVRIFLRGSSPLAFALCCPVPTCSARVVTPAVLMAGEVLLWLLSAGSTYCWFAWPRFGL